MHDVTLPVKGGEVPLRIYVPHSGTAGRSRAYKGVLLWLHGASRLRTFAGLTDLKYLACRGHKSIEHDK